MGSGKVGAWAHSSLRSRSIRRSANGKPRIRGLRYPVETLLELLNSGMTTDEILADSEDLERDDLLAVLAFAARLARMRRLQSAEP